MLLKRAVRVAIVMTAGVFLLWRIGTFSESSALYGLFAIFSMTVFADFGGPPSSRLTAFLVTIVFGAIGLGIASALTFSVWASVVGMAIYGFVVAYAGVLRGYVAAAGATVIVPFFISIATPNDVSRLPENVAAYVIGGLMATAGAMLIWPTYSKDRLRQYLGAALDRAADAIEAQQSGSAEDRRRSDQALTEAIGEVHKSYDASLTSPGAATSGQRDVMQVVNLLPSLQSAIRWRSRVNPEPIRSLDGLSEAVVATLRKSSITLKQLKKSAATVPDLGPLNNARVSDRQAEVDWVREHMADGGEAAMSMLDRHAPLRVLAGITVMVGSRARDYAGASKQADGMGSRDGRPMSVHLEYSSPWRALRANFTFASVWFRNSVRAGIAYALAVLVLLELGPQHAFWVVLGTLAAMKFDASGTKRTAIQMVIGTLIGFGGGAVIILLTQDSPTILWVLLPIAVGLASYTPGAISLTIGQASFTMFLIVLFGLLSPNGLTTDKARVEDVLLGVGVALVSSLLLWPHGAKGVVNESLLKALSAVSQAFVLAFELIPRKSSEPDFFAAAERGTLAMARALDNFDLALAQQLPSGFSAPGWLRTHSAAAEAMLNSDKIRFIAMGQSCPASGMAAAEQLIAAADGEMQLLRDVGEKSAEGQPAHDPRLEQDPTIGPHAAVAQFIEGQQQHLQASKSEIETILTMTWALGSIGHIHSVISHVAHPVEAG